MNTKKLPPYFAHTRRVHYYETDAMGVMHHSNYMRLFEESRVAWYNANGVQALMASEGEEAVLAVVDAHLVYRRPARFNDEIETRMQVRLDGTKFSFKYAIYLGDELLCHGSTLHVPVNKEMRPVRPPKEVIQFMKEVPWTETWP